MKYSGIIIGINYKSTDETIKWVKSIISNNDISDIRIIVVDTSAEFYDSNLSTLLNEIDRSIIYLNPNDNLGYFGGARYGKKYVDSQKWDFDFLIVSNVDLRFDSKNISYEIKKYLGNDVGVISPAILTGGIDINPYKVDRMNKKQMKRRLAYLKHPVLAKIVDCIRKIRKKRINKIKYPLGYEIYMTYGSCFIFTKHYFEVGADLNLPLFLYGEEPYVAEQCYQHSLKTIYVPSIRFLDIGHVSTSKIPSKKHLSYLIEDRKSVV